MAKPNQAWLLTPLGLSPCIVALHEVMQYLTEFQPLPVAFTPAHCTTAIVWQDQIVPVLNPGIFANEIFPGQLLGRSQFSKDVLGIISYCH